MKTSWQALLVALAIPSIASAQTASNGEARFIEARRRGIRLHLAAQHAEALRVFLGARTRFTGTPTELLGLIAQEELEIGPLSDGVRHAVECIARADNDLANPRSSLTRQRCLQLLERVRARLYSTTTEVRVGVVQIDAAVDAHPDLTVRVGGQEIPRSLWGQAIPMPEGRTTIQLTAPDAAPVRREVRVLAARRQRLVVGASTTAPVTIEDTPVLQVEAPESSPVATVARPARIDPGFGEVILRVVDPPDGTGVAVGGFDLPRVWWGHPFPVRPGVTQIEADAQGHIRTRRRVPVEAGRRVEVELRLDRVPEEPVDQPVTRAVAPPRRGLPWQAVTLTALGVGSIAAGGVLFLSADDRLQTLDASCVGVVPRTECDPALRGLHEEGSTLTTIANVATVTGAALGLAGAIWWIIDATHTPTPARRTAQDAIARRIWSARETR